MAKPKEIPKIDNLPDIFDLVLAGLVIGYNADYLRKQAEKGEFPAFQMFPNAERCAWRVHIEDFKKWLDERRSKSA